MTVMIFIPTSIFEDVLAKYTVDDTVYFHSGECPDSAFLRKILNGSIFPGGEIVHHFDFPMFFEDKDVYNKCLVEIRRMDENSDELKKYNLVHPQKNHSIATFQLKMNN